FQARNGQPHPFLLEHAALGLPTEDEIRAALRDLECPHAVFPNAPLDRWLADLVLDEQLKERSGDEPRRCRPDAELHPGGPRPYRKVYVAAKSFEATAALEPLAEVHGGRADNLQSFAFAPADVLNLTSAAAAERLSVSLADEF